jgi:hypothetical protein
MSELRFDLIGFGHGLQNRRYVGNSLDAFGDIPGVRALIPSFSRR